MYEVFINNNCLIFTEKQLVDKSYSIVFSDSLNWQELIDLLFNNIEKRIEILCPNISLAWHSFLDSVLIVKAAGGVVCNSNNQLLFIFRNNKWDLPKGKLEDNESIQDCAVREVEEECGVEQLIISSKLCNSYHIYKIDKDWILKETHWFVMQTSYKGDLIAQESEGIQMVEWVKLKDISRCLDKTYPNISKVIELYLKSIT